MARPTSTHEGCSCAVKPGKLDCWSDCEITNQPAPCTRGHGTCENGDSSGPDERDDGP